MNSNGATEFSSLSTSLEPWLSTNSNSDRGASKNFFVSSLPFNANTGVLREHAMRLNSSVECKQIDRAAYPETCSGAQPFTKSYTVQNAVEVRICVPGKMGTSPWSLKRNREDVSEELYMSLWVDGGPGRADSNVTVRCEAKTTRGFFELGIFTIIIYMVCFWIAGQVRRL